MLIFVIYLLILTTLIIKLSHFMHVNCKSKVCLVGKTAIVTGGNTGIGYRIVLGLLERGCRVIIADKAKDQNLLENIYKVTRSSNFVFKYVDLSSFKSTREFVSNFKKNEKALDILVHNAGIGRDLLEMTEDGLDILLQVNYFSAFLLTHLLIGIGYKIVLALAQRGCRVIIVDKSQDEKLLEKIFQKTRSRDIVLKYADLRSFSSVRQLADDLINNEEKLDILIHNAGIVNHLVATEDGLDTAIQVNYLSAFLLTHLVLDLLKKSKGRIIFTSSYLSFFNNLSLEKMKPILETIGDSLHYSNSKLCLIVAADMFAEKLKKYGITSNSYHPGFVNTNIFSYGHFGGMTRSKFILQMISLLAFLIGKSPEEGAQTAIYLACATEVENITGEFFFETKKASKPKLSRDPTFCQALWEYSEKLVGLKSDEMV